MTRMKKIRRRRNWIKTLKRIGQKTQAVAKVTLKRIVLTPQMMKNKQVETNNDAGDNMEVDTPKEQ